jgi:hypothetical protein
MRNSRATMAATIQAGKTRSTSMMRAPRTRILSAAGSSNRPRFDGAVRLAHQPSSVSVAIATAKTAVAQ